MNPSRLASGRRRGEFRVLALCSLIALYALSGVVRGHLHGEIDSSAAAPSDLGADAFNLGGEEAGSLGQPAESLPSESPQVVADTFPNAELGQLGSTGAEGEPSPTPSVRRLLTAEQETEGPANGQLSAAEVEDNVQESGAAPQPADSAPEDDTRTRRLAQEDGLPEAAETNVPGGEEGEQQELENVESNPQVDSRRRLSAQEQVLSDVTETVVPDTEGSEEPSAQNVGSSPSENSRRRLSVEEESPENAETGAPDSEQPAQNAAVNTGADQRRRLFAEEVSSEAVEAELPGADAAVEQPDRNGDSDVDENTFRQLFSEQAFKEAIETEVPDIYEDVEQIQRNVETAASGDARRRLSAEVEVPSNAGETEEPLTEDADPAVQGVDAENGDAGRRLSADEEVSAGVGETEAPAAPKDKHQPAENADPASPENARRLSAEEALPEAVELELVGADEREKQEAENVDSFTVGANRRRLSAEKVPSEVVDPVVPVTTESEEQAVQDAASAPDEDSWRRLSAEEGPAEAGTEATGSDQHVHNAESEAHEGSSRRLSAENEMSSNVPDAEMAASNRAAEQLGQTVDSALNEDAFGGLDETVFREALETDVPDIYDEVELSGQSAGTAPNGEARRRLSAEEKVSPDVGETEAPNTEEADQPVPTADAASSGDGRRLLAEESVSEGMEPEAPDAEEGATQMQQGAEPIPAGGDSRRLSPEEKAFPDAETVNQEGEEVEERAVPVAEEENSRRLSAAGELDSGVIEPALPGGEVDEEQLAQGARSPANADGARRLLAEEESPATVSAEAASPNGEEQVVPIEASETHDGRRRLSAEGGLAAGVEETVEPEQTEEQPMQEAESALEAPARRRLRAEAQLS